MINHIQFPLPQRHTRLFQNDTETCLRLVNLGFWEIKDCYVKALHSLISMRTSPTIDVDHSVTPSCAQSGETLMLSLCRRPFDYTGNTFFILDILDSVILFTLVAFKSGPEFTLEAYPVMG